MRPPFAAIRDLCREITAAVRLARREPWTGAVTFVPAVRRRPQPQRALSLRDPERHLRPRRGSTRFVALPGRLDDEIQEVLRRIVRRMHRLLRPDHERAQTDAGAPDALAAAQAHSVNLIWVSSRDPLRTKKQAAYLEGFSLHAGVHLQSASAVGFFVHADDWWQLESMSTVLEPPPAWFIAAHPERIFGMQMVRNGR